MGLSEQLFLFDEGNEVLFESSNGRLVPVIVSCRLYHFSVPYYMIPRPEDICDGVAASQSWLRPRVINRLDLRRFMKNNSPMT